jgi:hypothetical protein
MSFLTLEDFASRLNEAFSVEFGGSQAAFVLVEARPLPAGAYRGMARAPFSLVFHHASAVIFPQRIYQMENPGMGGFGIFLVPVARNQDGFLYQAVFN